MRVFLVMSLAAFSACASGTSTTRGPETESVRVGGAESGNIRMTSIVQAYTTPIDYPVGKVFHALPAAFEALAIPITDVDTVHHSLSNG